MSRFQRLRELFETAVAMPPNEVGPYLRAECGDDPEMLDEVWGMIAAHLGAQTQTVTTDPSETASLLGQFVGPYCIQDRIGSGGMGSVYAAIRADGAFRKRVALKVLKRHLVNEELVTRFHNERQVLANLDHPNIARILDGGQTADGRPYYAMELIDGIPLDRFCIERALSVTDRLKLFQQLCRAVDYLHEHLVIHRDLKPSNVLVTGESEIKLLDFGIAKAEYPITEGQMMRSARLMTPDYASPEQLNGVPTTRASDLYSLGVILYQLICGRLPEHSLAANGDRAVFTGISTELDRIAARCLKRDPASRYGSAADLSADLQPLIDERRLEPEVLAAAERQRSLAGLGAIGGLAVVFLVWQLMGTTARNGLLLFFVVVAAGLLSFLLIRWPDLTIAARGHGQRTREEEQRTVRGLLRSLVLDAVLFVPAGSALAWLILRPLLLRAISAFSTAIDGAGLGPEALLLHAILGMGGYLLFVLAPRRLLVRLASEIVLGGGGALPEPAAWYAVWYAERAGWLNELDGRAAGRYLASHRPARLPVGPWRDAVAMGGTFAAVVLLFALVYWAGFPSAAPPVADAAADVDAVIELVKHGVPESQILATIRARGETAPLTPRELLRLHEAKVPGAVIDALIGSARPTAK